MELRDKRIVVTGGAGFLGQHVVRVLRERGCTDIMVPRRSQYDLTREAAVEHLYRDERPEVVIHLVSRV
jgi:GDP-L-fucose synthase